MKKIIVSNQVICLLCGDKPYSAHRYDFKYCKCGAVAVDGGNDYLRRLAKNVDDYKDISICVDKDKVDLVMEYMQESMDRDCNARGFAYAAFRAMRDIELLKGE